MLSEEIRKNDLTEYPAKLQAVLESGKPYAIVIMTESEEGDIDVDGQLNGLKSMDVLGALAQMADELEKEMGANLLKEKLDDL